MIMQESYTQENSCIVQESLSQCTKCMHKILHEEMERHRQSQSNKNDKEQGLFFSSLNQISDHGTNLQQINVLLNINDELKIHPLALAQLSKEKQSQLLSATMKFKNDDINIKQFLDDKEGQFTECHDVRKKYKIMFDRETNQKLFYVANKLHVATEKSLNDFEINGNMLFAKIKSFEIQRLHQLFSFAFRGKDHFIKAAIKFAEYEKVTNIADFCAVCEFALIHLKEESGGATKKRKSASRTDCELTLANELVDTEKKMLEYRNKLAQLTKGCTGNGLGYFSPLCEVTHFVKHCRDDKNFKSLNFSTPGDYVKFLRDKRLECAETIITQEGTHYFCFYTFQLKERTYTLQILVDAFSKKETIVTAY